MAAMDELRPGNPWDLTTDVGPVIDAEALGGIAAYIDGCGPRVLKRMAVPAGGHFVGPTLIRVKGIAELGREVFGPVLHIARFRAGDLAQVISDINATGYGLTFGCHTRIDDRVQTLTAQVHAGNIYVNRNQIGAVVGSQPFGGEGLSGTGPKAGGPQYLHRLTAAPIPPVGADGTVTDAAAALRALKALPPPPAPVTQDMPGPTGESNRLTLSARAPLVCLGPGRTAADAQVAAVAALGGQAVAAPGLPPAALATLPIGGAVWWGDDAAGRPYARVLADRQGPILPLVGMPDAGHARAERHVCIDTTASGGNAQLLAAAGG
jgi:RHH-type transcriptional regulator, proline utilization regulon repressor / proline dehydrogenase / delta 1-pyrroline-5-carboxylate dehydrogenase